MNTWKVILATMVIFGTGVITGALVVGQSDHMRPFFVPPNLREPGPVPPSPTSVGGVPPGHQQGLEFLNRVQRELNLTSSQRERVQKIIADGQARMKEMWEPAARQIRQEMQQVREQIRAELLPEQRMRFEELLRQRPPRKLIEPPPLDRRFRDQRRPFQPLPGNPPSAGDLQQSLPGGEQPLPGPQPPPPDKP